MILLYVCIYFKKYHINYIYIKFNYTSNTYNK